MILAYDVTDRETAISWRTSAGVTGYRTETGGKATPSLLPLIGEIVAETGELPEKLGVITGPGSFTGIRVGLATAMGLRAATGLAVYGYTKFELLADQLKGNLLLQAGRNRAFYARFEGGRMVDGPRLVTPEEVSPDETWYAPRALEGFPVAALNVSLTELCLTRLAREQNEPDALEPMYIRPPDAKIGQTLIEKLLQRPTL